MISDKQTEEIQERIGYAFKKKDFLKIAFNHVSYANEKGVQSNETLEFLGDGLLNFLVAEILYDKEFGDEGRMSVLRAKIVSRVPLAREVERLGLLPYLKLGTGFDLEQNMSQKFVSNIYEAVLAAVYKDSGLKSAKSFLKRTLLDNLDLQPPKDFKTVLQEMAQAKKLSVRYEDSEADTKPPQFFAKVFVGEKLLGEGNGLRKKIAQQAAAKAATERMLKKTSRTIK